MKLIFFTYFLVVSSICIAQTNQDILTEKVTLSTEKATVQSVLNELSKKYRIRFSYEPTKIPLQKQITLPQKEMPLKDVLITVFKDTEIEYTVHAQVIILTKRLLPSTGGSVKKNEFYALKGLVVEKSTGTPLPFVNVYMPGIGKGTISDSNGIYQISNIAPGDYEIKFSFIGYKGVEKFLSLTSDVELNIFMEGTFTELQAVTVTPGTYSITSAEPTMNTLSSKEILLSPNFSKDINRTLRVIPGYANSDVSAKPRIRGGHWNETATFIDNFQIYEPYHFEETDGLASIFNTDNARDIKISTGGYSAKYTDKMSGIIEVKTPDYVDNDEHTASIDFLSAALYGKVRINDKTSVLYGLRRGYLDLMTKGLNSDISPIYYDIWCKVNYQLNDKNSFSLNLLKAKNDFKLTVDENLYQNLYFHNVKNNNYAWANWKFLPGKNYYINTTAGFQDLYANSDNYFIQSITPENIDKKEGGIFILNQNHLWNINPNHSLEFGFEWKKFREDYRFSENRYDLYNSTLDNILIDTINVGSHLKGNTFAAYIQHTWSLTEWFNFHYGIRLSNQSYTDKMYVAPRVAAKIQFTNNLFTKLAYGVYFQPDDFEKLKSFQGQSEPLDENQKCTHYIMNVGYKLTNTVFDLNVYHKDYQRLNDDFRYDVYNRIPFIIDIDFDTQSGKSSGLEFQVRHKYGKDNIVSLSYAYAKNTIKNSLGQETYRNFDRRNSIILNSVQNFGRNWTFSCLWLFHTGEPYTPYDIAFIGINDSDQNMFFYNTEKKNSGRVSDYSTVDIRFSKTWLFKKSRLNVYLNIVNLFNRNNISGCWWESWQNPNGKWIVIKESQSLNIPMFVSPGVSITF